MQVWVRNGWRPIVNAAAAQLRYIGVEVLEAREKLGTLRIHVPARDGRRPEVISIINQAARLAAETCDLCGQPGTLQSNTPWRVRCRWHAETCPQT